MKIIRKNKKRGDCGVVAAFNAASWCNAYRPYTEVEKLAKSCGYHPDKGIWHFQFANLVKKLGIPAKKVRPKSLEELQTSIYLGKFFVFLYTPTGQHTGHAITVFLDHTARIRIINPDEERVTWGDFASDVHANGMRNLTIYEIPRRDLVKKHDDKRAN